MKPSNILLQDGPWALLMDFGLAKLRSSSSNITASGTGVGTPDYMSPEQAQGRPVDARSDIYSLSVVLYQMLAADVPFHAETPLAVMLKQIADPPPLPSLKNPAINPAMEQVILRALAKAPEDRYASAGEMAQAFKHALDSKATLPVAPSFESQPTSQAARSSARMKWAIGAVAVLALVAIALVIVIAAIGSNASRSNSTAPSTSVAEIGAEFLDDFSGATVNTSIWEYTGTFTATLDSPAVSI